MNITKVQNTAVLTAGSVMVRPPLVEDLINAERISGKSTGFEFLAAVAASVCTFDGVAQPPEQVKKMAAQDFLSLSEALELGESPTSPTGSSSLPEKGNSDSNA